MILADENIDFKIIKALRNCGIETDSVSETQSGISDEEVIELAKTLNKIILTEDKDFGEWVFAHKVENLGIIFLRYNYSETDLIIDILLKLLNDRKEELFGKYTTITVQEIRIRNTM